MNESKPMTNLKTVTVYGKDYAVQILKEYDETYFTDMIKFKVFMDGKWKYVKENFNYDDQHSLDTYFEWAEMDIRTSIASQINRSMTAGQKDYHKKVTVYDASVDDGDRPEIGLEIEMTKDGCAVPHLVDLTMFSIKDENGNRSIPWEMGMYLDKESATVLRDRLNLFIEKETK